MKLSRPWRWLIGMIPCISLAAAAGHYHWSWWLLSGATIGSVLLVRLTLDLLFPEEE